MTTQMAENSWVETVFSVFETFCLYMINVSSCGFTLRIKL